MGSSPITSRCLSGGHCAGQPVSSFLTFQVPRLLLRPSWGGPRTLSSSPLGSLLPTRCLLYFGCPVASPPLSVLPSTSQCGGPPDCMPLCDEGWPDQCGASCWGQETFQSGRSGSLLVSGHKWGLFILPQTSWTCSLLSILVRLPQAEPGLLPSPPGLTLSLQINCPAAGQLLYISKLIPLCLCLSS